MRPNHSYAMVGKFSLSPPGFGTSSSTIHSIDLSTYSPSNPVAPTQQIASLPHVGFLNGLTTFDIERGIILAADSSLSSIWLIDTLTGSTRILLQEPEMVPPPGSTAVSISSISINGLHILNSKSRHNNVKGIYFSNSATSNFYHVATRHSSCRRSEMWKSSKRA